MSLVVVAAAASAVGCGGASAQARAAEVLDVTVPLDFNPSYLSVVPHPGGSYLYLEAERADGHTAYALDIDPSGAPRGAVTTLVPRFGSTMGEAFAGPDGALMVPLTRTPGGVEVVLELWRWDGAAEPERVASCYLPRPRFGRALYRGGEPTYVFESEDGRLAGLSLANDGAACGSPPRAVDLWLPPLPGRYLVGTLGDQLAISGEVGDSYTLRLYGPDLTPTRRMRMAVGAATEAWDFEVFELPGRPPLAVFAALSEGAHDLYLAELPAFGTSSVAAERVVATADAESEPHLLAMGDDLVVSWTVVNASGERLRLAAPRRDDGVRIRGGEILWRTSPGAAGRRAWAWVDTGFLRIWTEPAAAGGAALRLQVYEPTFWPR